MIISVDFDGTCVTHEFPYVGRDIGSVPVLKELVENGNQLILFTMRSDNNKGNFLKDAVSWFSENGIPLYGIQTNPSQSSWTSSPKAYAEMYIDDASLGCPLIYPENGERPYVDWVKVREILIDKDIIKENGNSQIS
jgi:hypothetical protein